MQGRSRKKTRMTGAPRGWTGRQDQTTRHLGIRISFLEQRKANGMEVGQSDLCFGRLLWLLCTESKGYMSGYRKGWLDETRIQLDARSLD